jgi:hypothetical protein
VQLVHRTWDPGFKHAVACQRGTVDLGDTNKIVSFKLADLRLKRFPTGRQKGQLLARGLTSIMWCALGIDENASIEICFWTAPRPLRGDNRV